MKFVLLGMSLLFASAVHAEAPRFTWNKKEVAALKGKSIYSIYCQKPTGYFSKEACASTAKSPSFTNYKFKNIEFVNSTTLRVGDGPRNVEITRGGKLGEFKMNGKTFDFANLSPVEVKQKISDAIPKVSASLFVSSAYADESTDFSDAIRTMLSSKVDDDTCAAAQKVVDYCGKSAPVSEASLMFSSIADYQQATTISDKAVKAKTALKYIAVMNSMLSVSGAYMTIANSKAPESCQVNANGGKVSAKSAISDCSASITLAINTNLRLSKEMKLEEAASLDVGSEVTQGLIKLREEMPRLDKAWTKEDQENMKKSMPLESQNR